MPRSSEEGRRGSGAAFWSNGVDYIDRLTTRLVPQEYDLPLQEAERVASLYREWEQGHHFASLTAVAIPSKTNEQEACAASLLGALLKTPKNVKVIAACALHRRGRVVDLLRQVAVPRAARRRCHPFAGGIAPHTGSQL